MCYTFYTFKLLSIFGSSKVLIGHWLAICGLRA
jgi:hypothetical protein